MDKVDEYIDSNLPEIRSKLIELRALILSCSKEITEHFAYGLPAYKFKGKPLIYFGSFKDHISIFATPIANEKFKDKLTIYKTSKGTVQFQNDQEIPFELIKEMVKFKMSSISRPVGAGF